MSKIKKLILKPGLFFRDFLIKRYPVEISKIESLNIQELAEPTFPIDIVYTWVDISDLKYYKKRKKYLDKKKFTNSDRFKNHNELKYSLRSVMKNLPWINKIYIVTDNQIPPWLDLSNEKIKIISHDEIIPKKFLPTFNSHVIGSFLHRIPKLNEHYIYLNDDILIAKPLTPKNFFTCGGLAISYVSNNELGNTEVSDCDISTIAAAKNARKIIYHKYKYFFSRRIKHIFHSQIKSLAEEIEINNINSLNEMRFNKFRKNNDILFSSFLCPYIGYIKGKFIFKNNIKYHYIKIRNIQSKNTYEEIVKKNKLVREVICINDTLNVDFVLDNYEKYLEEFLIKLYPIPSQLEKT